MARYQKGHKTETRQRIIDRAGNRLKSDGIAGSGVSTLMADAGLTHGAFYAHFASKEELVAQVLVDQVRRQREAINSSSIDHEGFERFVRAYLSPVHRDTADQGCPSAALIEEVGRSADATRAAYSEAFLEMIDELANALIAAPPEIRRTRMLSVFAGMVGVLQVSRALVDRDLADSLLCQGIEDALALVDSGGSSL